MIVPTTPKEQSSHYRRTDIRVAESWQLQTTSEQDGLYNTELSKNLTYIRTIKVFYLPTDAH